MTTFNIQDILLKQLPIPTVLLKSYKSLDLNEQDVMLILHIHQFSLEQNEFPTPTELATYVTMNEGECAHILKKLIQKGLLAIEQTENEHQQLSEIYSLNPLWEKLFNNKPDDVDETEQLEGTIFILFEQEFGRPLSPFEIEIVNTWLDEDNIAPALIKAGLRESVLMGKLNFTYIDRILRNWKRQGIHSVEEAREASQAFRDRQVKKQSDQSQAQKDHTSIYYNWLEGGDT